jgi:hypothetical protein
MSKIASKVHTTLKELFPLEIIVEEYYVKYKGVQLFFDFYLKGLGLLFEIQGRQHYEFVKHFHGTIDGLNSQRRRDNLKKEYVSLHKDLTLVYFYDTKDKITKDLVLHRIYESQNRRD